MRKLVVVGLLLISALALAACGGGGAGAAQDLGKVTMVDNSFQPNTLTAKPGTLKITLENKGTAMHDFSITALNIKETLNANQSKTITIPNVKAGEYEVICSQAGHKELGMVGKLTVQ